MSLTSTNALSAKLLTQTKSKISSRGVPGEPSKAVIKNCRTVADAWAYYYVWKTDHSSLAANNIYKIGFTVHSSFHKRYASDMSKIRKLCRYDAIQKSNAATYHAALVSDLTQCMKSHFTMVGGVRCKSFSASKKGQSAKCLDHGFAAILKAGVGFKRIDGGSATITISDNSKQPIPFNPGEVIPWLIAGGTEFFHVDQAATIKYLGKQNDFIQPTMDSLTLQALTKGFKDVGFTCEACEMSGTIDGQDWHCRGGMEPASLNQYAVKDIRELLEHLKLLTEEDDFHDELDHLFDLLSCTHQAVCSDQTLKEIPNDLLQQAHQYVTDTYQLMKD